MGEGSGGSREEEETDPVCQWPGHLDEARHGKTARQFSAPSSLITSQVPRLRDEIPTPLEAAGLLLQGRQALG